MSQKTGTEEKPEGICGDDPFQESLGISVQFFSVVLLVLPSVRRVLSRSARGSPLFLGDRVTVVFPLPSYSSRGSLTPSLPSQSSSYFYSSSPKFEE